MPAAAGSVHSDHRPDRSVTPRLGLEHTAEVPGLFTDKRCKASPQLEHNYMGPLALCSSSDLPRVMWPIESRSLRCNQGSCSSFTPAGKDLPRVQVYPQRPRNTLGKALCCCKWAQLH